MIIYYMPGIVLSMHALMHVVCTHTHTQFILFSPKTYEMEARELKSLF